MKLKVFLFFSAATLVLLLSFAVVVKTKPFQIYVLRKIYFPFLFPNAPRMVVIAEPLVKVKKV